MSQPRRSVASRELCRDVLAIVLAGGQGTRLHELTRWEAKPALPFGGQHRHIDFPLSNCLNSGIRRIGLVTQYKAHSLIQHVREAWGFLRPDFGEFVELWPAQQRIGEDWYVGTANAVHQNADIIEAHAPEYVLVLAGDHVYQMDYRPMLEAHRATGADATVGCVEVPIGEAHDFGVLAMNAHFRITGFAEKPSRPAAMPGHPGTALASMGIYVFKRDFLLGALAADATDPDSAHDFGRDLIPAAIDRADLCAFPFRDPETGEPGYWRDIGTLARYWDANMELLAAEPRLNLHDGVWPIWTRPLRCPPARFGASASVSDSIVAPGCIIDGTLRHSIVSTGACIGRGARVENALILPGARIGRQCVVRNAIVDSHCVLPDGAEPHGTSGGELHQCYATPDGVLLVTSALAAPDVETDEELQVA